MKTTYPQKIWCGLIVMSLLFLLPRPALSQTTDSLSQASSGSLQFQLLGGVGINYLSDCGPVSYLRIGVDGSLSHSDGSGDGSGYSTYSFGGGSPSSSSIARQPEQKSTVWNVSVSGVYALKVVEYANSELYCGAGPMVSYSNSTFSNSSSSTRTETGGTYIETNTSGNTNKTWGLGPLAIVGVRHQLLDHVGLSAEINVSALYEWRSQTSASRSTTTVLPPGGSTSSFGDTSHLKGWRVSLSNIRIGVILDL